jgi:hypothetical protein
MIHRRSIHVALLTSLVLTVLAWCYSASSSDRVAFARGQTFAAAVMNDGVISFQLFSSSRPFQHVPSYIHEPRSPATYWPPAASGPQPPHTWQGLGYVSRHFSDGFMFGIIVPFWLVLLLLSAAGLYVFRRPPLASSADNSKSPRPDTNAQPLAMPIPAPGL